ncbi:MAG TPA: UDP-N-acetyl-D-mannosamine dehydrogenase, partial [Anaerolineaceae bacterium]|nr:UDP-N-acetyl-D-mannosamine dehydrogenase [Anaerolineaceae bacterium]
MEFNTICVMGLGYIGLPTASTFASRGIKVIGVDANPRVVESLQNGHVHIYEPGLRELVGDSLASGNLIIRNQPEPADAFIIAVPTPFYDDKKADMRFVRSAAEAIAPFVRQGNLVVLESTSPPMTTCGIVTPILERGGMKAGEDFYLTYSPERVLPGQILRELIENAR